MATLPLTTRDDFFEVLEATLAEARQLAAKTPGFPPYQAIAEQLEAMQSFTAGGRTPTDRERDSISVGLIAVRELDPELGPEMADFIDRLHELNGYFREWP
jgi:Tsi6